MAYREPGQVVVATGCPLRSMTRRGPCTSFSEPRTVRRWFEEPVLARTAFEPLVANPLTLAACVLPDHVHWLLDDSRGLSATVGRYKSFVTTRARTLGHPDAPWQRSFWDHVVRSSEKLDVVARYVVENPIRVGLCRRIEDYPYVVMFPDRIEGLR